MLCVSVSHANGDSDVRALEMLRTESAKQLSLDGGDDACARGPAFRAPSAAEPDARARRFVAALNTTCRLSEAWAAPSGGAPAGDGDDSDELEDSDDDDDAEGAHLFGMDGLSLVAGWETMRDEAEAAPSGGVKRAPSRGSILFSDFTSTGAMALPPDLAALAEDGGGAAAPPPAVVTPAAPARAAAGAAPVVTPASPGRASIALDAPAPSRASIKLGAPPPPPPAATPRVSTLRLDVPSPPSSNASTPRTSTFRLDVTPPSNASSPTAARISLDCSPAASPATSPKAKASIKLDISPTTSPTAAKRKPTVARVSLGIPAPKAK